VSDEAAAEPTGVRPPSDGDIRALVARLGRPHASGGTVIERAALLAEGADFDVTLAWILARGGEPEGSGAAPPRRGLYGSRPDTFGAPRPRPPQRFVLPPGALDA
jgi:hypothetical protein